jgi:hypothetical protein
MSVCEGGVGGGFGIATLNVASMVINDDLARIHQSTRVVYSMVVSIFGW